MYIFIVFRLVDCYLNSAVRSHLSYLNVTTRALVGGPVRTEWCKMDSGTVLQRLYHLIRFNSGIDKSMIRATVFDFTHLCCSFLHKTVRLPIFCQLLCSGSCLYVFFRTKLQLFRTSKKGWGVRAQQDIPQGTFVCE